MIAIDSKSLSTKFTVVPAKVRDVKLMSIRIDTGAVELSFDGSADLTMVLQPDDGMYTFVYPAAGFSIRSIEPKTTGEWGDESDKYADRASFSANRVESGKWLPPLKKLNSDGEIVPFDPQASRDVAPEADPEK